ncbi:MAG: S1 RNA-binding domain-containing protein [Faecousia sp.]
MDMTYAPEGLYPLTPITPEALHRAAGSREIFQAMCIKCDEYHNLLVDLGPTPGLIPREEAALGVRQGTVREIAILSRVGKPVCFQVLGFTSEGTALLSRRGAQEEARLALLESLRPGDILPAVVQSLASFGVFCDIGCGLTALMSIERCSVSRISHCNQRFSPGQRIYAAVLSIEGDRINLTHRELLGTWAENAACFRPGQTVTGIVRSLKPYGVFIELTPNLSGLAEPREDLEPGQPVSVYIRSITPEHQKIKLTVLEKLPGSPHPAPMRYFRTSGHLDRWDYAPGSGSVTLF